jgi:hypothetical protein
LGEVVEGMTVGVVSEFRVGCRESLQTLQSYFSKVSGEVGVLGQNHRATRHKAVYKWLLHHVEKPKQLRLCYEDRDKKERDLVLSLIGIYCCEELKLKERKACV